MKQLGSGVLLLIASVLFVLGIFEISFPDTFSWTEILIDRFPTIYRYGTWIGIGECALSALVAILAWKNHADFSRKGLETIFRLGLGGMYIFASLFKIHDPHGFAVLIAQYQFLPHNVVNLFGLIMPMAEFCFE